MLYYTVMIDKGSAGSYKHSHKKSTKSFEKHLTQYKVSGKIHSLTASQPHSLTASQPHSLTASQPHSLTASQPHS
ncbi:hypothetical protein H0R89_01930 [Treponema putidum]